MMTPDPIQNWHFEVDGLPGQLQWRARRWEPKRKWGPEGSGGWYEAHATREVAYFDADGFHLEDQQEHDGSPYLCVSSVVLDTLRALQAGEQPNVDATRSELAATKAKLAASEAEVALLGRGFADMNDGCVDLEKKLVAAEVVIACAEHCISIVRVTEIYSCGFQAFDVAYAAFTELARKP